MRQTNAHNADTQSNVLASIARYKNSRIYVCFISYMLIYLYIVYRIVYLTCKIYNIKELNKTKPIAKRKMVCFSEKYRMYAAPPRKRIIYPTRESLCAWLNALVPFNNGQSGRAGPITEMKYTAKNKNVKHQATCIVVGLVATYIQYLNLVAQYTRTTSMFCWAKKQRKTKNRNI